VKKPIDKPTLILNEQGKKQHPLVYLASLISTAEIGKLLGHSNHSTASIYVNRARKAPTTRIPAEWVLPIARYLDRTPHSLRPDLYLPRWTVDNGN
jgi:hypothetical protein